MNELCEAIEAQASTVARETGWGVEVGKCDPLGGFIVTAQGQTVQIVNLRRYLNSTVDAALELREFDCRPHVARQGYRTHYALNGIPEAERSTRMPIRRLPHLGWCWEINGRQYPSSEAAKAIVAVLLDRISAQKRAEGYGYGDERSSEESFEPGDHEPRDYDPYSRG
jgi:hypothetical protein